MNRWHAFTQLVLSRFRDFYREPEVIFWAYGFPLILTVGLHARFCQCPHCRDTSILPFWKSPGWHQVTSAVTDRSCSSYWTMIDTDSKFQPAQAEVPGRQAWESSSGCSRQGRPKQLGGAPIATSTS
jgi:hypothetical protein